MNITIKKSRDDDKRKTIWIPMEEDIEGSRDERFSNILADKNVNIDELNYLMKRFDGFSPREIEKFCAATFTEEPNTMADLVSLSFNLHCYSLINNFSDFDKLGKDLY